MFLCHNPKGIKHLTELRVNFSHLWDHEFKHSFEDTISQLCICSLEAETNHFILHFPYYENERYILVFAVSQAVSWIKMMTT